MAQAKKKTATKTTKKASCTAKSCRKGAKCEKCKHSNSNMFFVICMSMLAATLLFADLIMINM